MPRELIRVVDVSEYSGRIPSWYSWWGRIREQHNVQAAVIQAWGGGPRLGRRNEFFHQQFDGARAAGLSVAAYVWPPRETDWALAWMTPSYVERSAFIAPDVEAGEGVTRDVIATIRAAGARPLVYTSPTAWDGIMQDATWPADEGVDLWVAHYPYRAAPTQLYPPDGVWWPSHRYFDWPHRVSVIGGWVSDQAVGWQFQGTTSLEGVSCDLNVFDAAVFQRPGGDIVSAEADALRREMRQGFNDLASAIRLAHEVQQKQIEALRTETRVIASLLNVHAHDKMKHAGE